MLYRTFLNKIFKIILPVIFLFLLYKNSYISLDPIKSLFLFGDKKLILKILNLTFLGSLFLYFRFIYCLKIYQIKTNIFKLIRISAQAYSFASFIPGAIGIDAWRISKLRKLDLTKFKTNLINSSILEKIFALLSQIFIIIFFLIDSNIFKTLLLILSFIFIYLIVIILKILGSKYSLINNYSRNINFKNLSILFSICTITNLIWCYLIRFIGISLNMNFSLKVMTISSTLSHMSTVIPISPNGLGVSEFIFSEITQTISNLDTNDSIATIYFSYRILNLFSHFLIYYFLKIRDLFKNQKIKFI